MVDFRHAAQKPAGDADPRAAARRARIGLRLFALYLLLYGAFVLVSAFQPDWMGEVLISGINLAVVSGLGLIFVAFLVALVYDWLCRPGAAHVPVTSADTERGESH